MPEVQRNLFAAHGTMAWLDVVVRRRWCEARDIVAIELMAAPDRELPSFEAGAFIDVLLPDGQVRPYSLANAPQERGIYLLAVLLEPLGQGASRALHGLRAGDSLRVSAPRNAFPLHGGALHHVLLAGGIGITPLLSMAEQLWRTAASFELHYGYRIPERAAFLSRLRGAPYAHRVSFYPSGSGRRARIDAAAVLARVSRQAHVYLCGPGGFMDDALGAAARLGWPRERLHHETFGPAAAAATRIPTFLKQG